MSSFKENEDFIFNIKKVDGVLELELKIDSIGYYDKCFISESHDLERRMEGYSKTTAATSLLRGKIENEIRRKKKLLLQRYKEYSDEIHALENEKVIKNANDFFMKDPVNYLNSFLKDGMI